MDGALLQLTTQARCIHLLLLLLLLRRGPRALEGGPSERQHLTVDRGVTEWGTTEIMFRKSVKVQVYVFSNGGFKVCRLVACL